MKKIGKLLKEKRIELGYSVEDISKKTRLTLKHVSALEEGDISFFREDLSYLRFFVKSYCEAVDIDFDDIKDDLRLSVDDYTATFATNMQLSHQEIEKNIANSEKLTKVQTANVKVKKRPNFKKPDVSLVSLIAIVGVVAIVIIFAFVIFLNSNSNKTPASNNKLPLAPEQSENGDNKYPSSEENEGTPVAPKEIEVSKDESMNDGFHYVIENIKEGDELKIQTLFGTRTSFSMTVINDGKAEILKDPASTIYDEKTKAEASIIAKKGMKIQVYFGYVYQSTISINEKNVKIDEALSNSLNSATLEFRIGDSNESSK